MLCSFLILLVAHFGATVLAMGLVTFTLDQLSLVHSVSFTIAPLLPPTFPENLSVLLCNQISCLQSSEKYSSDKDPPHQETAMTPLPCIFLKNPFRVRNDSFLLPSWPTEVIPTHFCFYKGPRPIFIYRHLSHHYTWVTKMPPHPHE